MEAVAWRYRYPNESKWQLTLDRKQAHDKTGEAQPLYASPVVPTPEGEAWRVVPVEPTEAMIKAGETAAWDDSNTMPAIRAMRKAYAAMLEASPVVPVGVREEQRQRVAEIVEAAIERHAPTKGICHTLDDADAILAALGTTDQGSRSKASVPTEVGQAAVLTAEQIEEDRLRDEDEALMPGGFN
jgi:hypothetical protein